MGYRGQIASAMLWTVIGCFVALYVLEEIRGWRVQRREPLLAPKVVLGMLLTLGIQFLVAGVAILVATLVDDTGQGFTRAGKGLAISGGLNLIVPGLLYWKFVRPRSEPDILQKALGINAAIFGVLSGLWITSTVMSLLQGTPVATSLILSTLYTTLLIVSSLILLIPLAERVDNNREKEGEPDYTSYEDQSLPS